MNATLRMAAPYLDKKWTAYKCKNGDDAYRQAREANANGCASEAWETRGNVTVRTYPK